MRVAPKCDVEVMDRQRRSFWLEITTMISTQKKDVTTYAQHIVSILYIAMNVEVFRLGYKELHKKESVPYINLGAQKMAQILHGNTMTLMNAPIVVEYQCLHFKIA